MLSVKTILEQKIRECNETINFYKLYIDILPDEIYSFIHELTIQLEELEEKYNKINKSIEIHTHVKIENLGKIKLEAFKQTCKKYKLSSEQINELKKERRLIKNRMYAQTRRDKFKLMHS